MEATHRCTKDFKMENGDLAFTKGKIYHENPGAIGFDPEVRMCLVDDNGEYHWVTDSTYEEYFVRLSGLSMAEPRVPDGYECACGNSITYEESEGGHAIFCNRCDRGGEMEPVYNDL